MVCNYGPAGNIMVNPVYEQGDPGSNCPAGTSKITQGPTQGLCAINKN